MIVIVDDNTERGLALRHSALSAFLPCAFCSVSEFVHFPHGKDIVVLCADREDQLSALGSADKAELIVINHTGKKYHQHRRIFLQRRKRRRSRAVS